MKTALCINVLFWGLFMAAFIDAQAAAPEVTTAIWLEPEQKLRVLGQGGEPGQRVYVRIPETVGNRHVQADGSFRANIQGVYPPPCEVDLLPQFGAPGPTHAIADPRDFLTGEAIRHECMPAGDKAVVDASETGELPGLGVITLLDMPSKWCRFDVGAEQRLYWPYTGTGCTPTIELMDTITAMSVGKSQWVGLGCTMPMRTTVFIVQFTPAFSAFVGGAATPDWGDGHILVDTALSTESPEAIPGSVLHELTHVAQFEEGFTLAELSFTVWSEAVAVAAMMRGMPGSLYWVDAHGPWPSLWLDGLGYERDKARHAGLFFHYLEQQHNFNVCDFMGSKKALLKDGKELDAFQSYSTGGNRISYLFSVFTHWYNVDRSQLSPEIEAAIGLAPPLPTPLIYDFGSVEGLKFDLTGTRNGEPVVIDWGSTTIYDFYDSVSASTQWEIPGVHGGSHLRSPSPSGTDPFLAYENLSPGVNHWERHLWFGTRFNTVHTFSSMWPDFCMERLFFSDHIVPIFDVPLIIPTTTCPGP